jgi:hypothetical protein
MLSDNYTVIQLVYIGKGHGHIVLIHTPHNDKLSRRNVLATFNSLGHLHHIITLFLASSYDSIVYHELDAEIEHQTREITCTFP